MDWFLYDNSPRHEGVNTNSRSKGIKETTYFHTNKTKINAGNDCFVYLPSHVDSVTINAQNLTGQITTSSKFF